MRFNAIIISALAVASLGVKAAPAADGKLDARNDDDCDWKCVPRTHTPPPCVEYCIFEGWDCNTGDLHGFVSQAPDIKGCAANGFSKPESVNTPLTSRQVLGHWPICDASVHNGNFCYGKGIKDAKVSP
ncbi:hypothetical protein QFC24_006893 [Naganishia onofrii]|uniref:Uncharacterized protein n=1 Tax=Naganishia onofrii TaxID=1851511 RepID=A0ACC2WXB4_9TREE|nr:hypothetical protein QFC24_006893 [Naganishia onofrii]